MNVLHIESGLNWGGQEYRNVVEAQWLIAHGHPSWLVCDPESQSFLHAREMGVPVIPLCMRRSHYPVSFGKLWSICRQHKVDVVQTHSSFDSWLCYPLHLLGYRIIRSRNITNRISRFSRAFIYRFGCTRVIATAECIKQDLVEHARVPAGHIYVVGEGVDLKVFNPQVSGQTFRAELGVPPGAMLVGMIAMLRSEKGVGDFIDAAKEILKTRDDVYFVIVGSGRQQDAVRAKVQDFLNSYQPPANGLPRKSSAPPIIMAGYRKDVPQILAALDIVVIPSRAEARCRVLAEAMAIGRPVVATNVGGIPEVLKDGVNGLLVPAKAPHRLASSISRLMSDHGLRTQLTAAAWSTAQTELSLDSVMQVTLDIYRNISAV